ncbi:uncharacterized protein LTR77_010130 [Saxophila tyrrhenica]|uniref:Uncharacterized protein n=1 Tax=Saxophila tyrrhenica TaxID=1690608 RepID=A0AAV9NXN4_9PEZI|nr:hypothetical protein LTR77_010130 [Saxophila tyrrhenica]
MKAPKLPKLKSSNDVNATNPETSMAESTLRASVDDLRSPGSRDLLRQHFTGAFPETQRRTNQERYSEDAGLKPRQSSSTSSLNVGQNSAAQSSSSSLDKHGMNNMRLSAVAEDHPSLDIAQAIHLLQELKKNASPSDLVALHKALLPTRDSYMASPTMPNNEDRASGNFSTSTVIRRGSMLPAGLATRGDASEDLLRRQEDVKQPIRQKKSKTGGDFKTHLRQKLSQGSLAALDLADEAGQTLHARAATPADDLYTVGHYRPGTLRITNGAASPEPGALVRERINSDLDGLPSRREAQTPRKSTERGRLELQPVTTRGSQDYATAPSTPRERPSFEHHVAGTAVINNAEVDTEPPRQTLTRSQTEPAAPPLSEQPSFDTPRKGRSRHNSRSRDSLTPRDSSISGIPHPKERDESVPRIYKRQRPHRARERSQSATPRSRDPSLTRIPMPKESAASLRGSTIMAHKVSEQSLLHPIRRSFDDGRVSPLPEEMPRFAHRWSHRASQISQEYVAECEISASPYGEQAAAEREALLKRLSTVFDSEDEQVTDNETPETALSRLNGDTVAIIKDHIAPRETSETKEGASPSQHFLRNFHAGRPTPQKADSGYGTDNSLQEHQRQMLQDASRLYNNNANLRNDSDEAVKMDDDVQSLYSLNQILRSPSLLSPAASPSSQTPASRKQRSSLLRLVTSSRGNSSNSLPITPVTEKATEKAPDSTPSEVKRSKSQKKKLQKPMPDAVKKELKEQRKKQKEQQETKSANPSETFTLTEQAPAGSGRFSWEPAAASPISTPGPTQEQQAHLESRPSLAETRSKKSFHRDDDAAFSANSPITRKRSKSLGRERQRSNTVRDTAEEDVGSSSRRTSWGLASRKSRRSSEHSASRPTDLDVPPMPNFASTSSDESKNDGDEEAPMWTDYSSVSRTLGVNPYDISTNLMRRTVALPGGVNEGLQSPHQITTAVYRSKNGGLQGMDSGMAAELARLKSRDIASSNNQRIDDRPRMATPRLRENTRSMSSSTAPVPTAVVARRPMDRRGSLPSEAAQQQIAELSARPLSGYADSIPPMPELPADVARGAPQGTAPVDKQGKDSAQPTPVDSERSSSSEETPGHSRVSVADAVRKTMEHKKQVGEVSEQKCRVRPIGPRQESATSLQAQVQTILRTPSDGSASIQIGLGSDTGVEEKPAVAAVSEANKESAEESIAADWSAQAKIWKERRRTLGESLAKPATGSGEAPMSPVSPLTSQEALSPFVGLSRSITPQVKDSSQSSAWPPNARTSSGEEKEVVPAAEQDDSRSQTPHASSTDLLGPQSARAANTSHIAHQRPIHRERSPGGRVITPSGNFHPYTPADAPSAERSRRKSIGRPTPPADAPRLEQSRPETLAKLTSSSTTNFYNTTTTTTTTSQASRSTQSLEISRGSPMQSMVHDSSLFDRYAGGMQYGYEKGSGFGGSAGTRSHGKSRAERKSRELSVGFGVDLSDVPVFLRKV